MVKSYTYNENGELEEELELSLAASGEAVWCERCQEVTYHAVVAISSGRGHVYACEQWGFEVSGE